MPQTRPKNKFRPFVVPRRSGVALQPCAGRGLNPRPERSTPAKYPSQFQIQKNISPKRTFQLIPIFCPLTPLPSRGWIIPVGGSTPDRLKDDRLRSKKTLPNPQNHNPRKKIEKIGTNNIFLWHNPFCHAYSRPSPAALRQPAPAPLGAETTPHTPTPPPRIHSPRLKEEA